ncbi:MAG: DUF1552 domain-containing protein [Verrucomicrobiota bacterium]
MNSSSAPHLSLRKPLNRRTFLRCSGGLMALPWLQAMSPSVFANTTGNGVPRRLICVHLHLGFMAKNFTPKETGAGYTAPKYLKQIDHHRDHYSVITGTSHPGVNGAHSADVSFLTGAPDAASASFKNSVSFDQIAAERIGGDTRYAYLPLGLTANSMSFSHSGANLPAIHSPAALYRKLFVEGSPAEKARFNQQLEDGRSIMDFVGESAQELSRKLGARDREKLDEYFTNVRETEQRLEKSRAWQDIEKPEASAPAPKDIQDRTDFIGRIGLMYDMIHLAVQSDSTRVITFNQPNLNDVAPIQGINQGYHSLSHHNNDPDKLRQLEIVEQYQMEILNRLLESLLETEEDGAPLMDRSILMVGSIFGNANTHDTSNMPILLAGGGFNHGRHLAFDPTANEPTANLYLSLLRQLGVHDVHNFSSSTGLLPGLDLS